MESFEVNFDGLVGPTHSYAGLSFGNVASMSHRAQIANPREAALQGLKKAKALADLGLKQGIFPPQMRPDLEILKRIGFTGSTAEILRKASQKAPELLNACSSASSMWTANAATVSPSADSLDNKVHFTSANLTEKFHRSIEHPTTSRVLRAIFPEATGRFVHHEALPASGTLGDEGAANHTRFCREYGEAGLQFFVYGRVALDGSARVPKKFPARQTKEASESIARLHRLKPDQVYFAQQNPDCIDAGAFHNDVVSVGNKQVLFYHESAFFESDRVIGDLGEKFAEVAGLPFEPICVPSAQVSLGDAVKSYLFNSQLLSVGSDMVLVAPRECLENESVKSYLDELLDSRSTPIKKRLHFDLRQSMENGGGPACLRLRVVLTEPELAKVNPGVMLNAELYAKLTDWVVKHYRDRLKPQDFADPQLHQEVQAALDDLTQIMSLGPVYSFQR